MKKHSNLVPHDLLTVAHNIRPGSMYMLDTTVPMRFQPELSSKMNNPLVYEMNGNHIQGIIKAGTISCL
jgi:hypothetical protein